MSETNYQSSKITSNSRKKWPHAESLRIATSLVYCPDQFKHRQPPNGLYTKAKFLRKKVTTSWSRNHSNGYTCKYIYIYQKKIISTFTPSSSTLKVFLTSRFKPKSSTRYFSYYVYGKCICTHTLFTCASVYVHSCFVQRF